MSRTSSQNGAISGAFARIAPFFLPALLFQTGAFAFISPVPLLILTLRASVPVSLAALVCNALILIAFRNQPGILIGPFLWFGIGVFFPLLIRKTGKIQQSFALSYAAMITLLVVALSVSAHHAQLGIVDYVRAEIGRGIDQLLVNPDKATKVILEEEGR